MRPLTLSLTVSLFCARPSMGASVLLLFLSLIPANGSAQFLPSATDARINNALVGVYALSAEPVKRDTKSPAASQVLPNTVSIPGHKNGTVAALLSLAVPGLGEYYVGEQIWRGMIFSGLEVGMWLGRAHYNARGDDSTAAFRAFADTYWSPDRYAAYLNSLLASRGIGPWADGKHLETINHTEDTLDALQFQNFTHRLPIRDRQQYYELISKYIQYTAGWDDATNPQDPTSSVHYQEHADMRERMNDQYATATYFMWGIIANHVLSAIDAALLAHDHNTQIRLQGELLRRPLPDGSLGYVPTATVEYRF
jgi:hypothetical protein